MYKWLAFNYVIFTLFQVYWVWLAKYVPLWVAPSLITFLGVLLNTLVTALVVSYDHNINGEVYTYYNS